MPAYKSYCWSLGTTSFRMVEFNRKIEQQLQLLNDFWAIPQYQHQNWKANNAVQVAYYEYIKEQGFIEDKEANRKDKDAREKTSGLVDLGLVNDERRLTSAGHALLAVAQSGNFADNNLLQIPADSFIYFKQLLKLSCQFDNEHVRPYAVLAYMLAELGEISKEEFTYLVPLAINREKTDMIINCIREIRNGNTTIDDVIVSVLMQMDNYRLAQIMFNNESNVDNLIMQEIGMNRKSRTYDNCYTDLYRELNLFRFAPEDCIARSLFQAVKNISGKASIYWKQYLFNTSLTSVVQREGASTVNRVNLFRTNNEEEFRKEFFKLLHLFKAKSLLDDYYDLNKRYFKTSDTLLFNDDIVKFDIIPNCYFAIVKDSLLDIAFTKATNLGNFTNLSDMGRIFDISQEQLFEKAEELYGVQVRSIYDIQGFIDRERYERLNQMIDEKFTDENLVRLMTYFENRDDNDIQSLVTNNADVPTIFEYVLAIAWYKISGRQGKILEYMNLHLDADLLPVSHASGGHEDITYKYEETEKYPAHTLLIETTLAGGTNQRRMEMEPVSRHLGTYLVAHNDNAYCLFVSPYLDPNVMSDFRGRKLIPFRVGNNIVNSMKIISCATEEIKTIIQNRLTYSDLYPIFETAYQSNIIEGAEWYLNEIKNRF